MTSLLRRMSIRDRVNRQLEATAPRELAVMARAQQLRLTAEARERLVAARAHGAAKRLAHRTSVRRVSDIVGEHIAATGSLTEQAQRLNQTVGTFRLQ